jgi:hypothetical protein
MTDKPQPPEKAKRQFNPRGSTSLPKDVKKILADSHDIDMDLTFAIWQGLMLNVSCSLLDRADFDIAWQAWSRQPKQHPIMTMILDIEEHMSATILSLEVRRLAA